MTKNKLEKLFSKSLKAHPEYWGMKLHNNPLAHQNTPGDYLLTIEQVESYITYVNVLLIECKQVTCKEGKGRLAHKRLKQLHDMLSFDKHSSRHKAIFCIAFWDERWDRSEIYFIPAQTMYEKILRSTKESFNREEMKLLFGRYKADVKTGGVIDLWRMDNPMITA